MIKRMRTETVYRNSDLLVYILEGYATYEFNGQEHIARAGDVVYLSRGCTYSRKVHSDCFNTLYINFNFDVPADVVLPCYAFTNIKNADTEFKRIYKKWFQNDASHISSCMSILYELYASLIRSEISNYLPSSKREPFEAAVKEIQNSYTNEELSVADLAASAQMSEVHFRRLFKKIYKMSPQQYIMSLKITRAKEMLEYSSYTISEISNLLGFSDPCYFSRVFREKTDYTPTEYRIKFS